MNEMSYFFDYLVSMRGPLLKLTELKLFILFSSSEFLGQARPVLVAFSQCTTVGRSSRELPKVSSEIANEWTDCIQIRP